jgi:hypothetical protein
MVRKYRPQNKLLPGKYRRGFLYTMDGRLDFVKSLRASYSAVLEDLGGRGDVGHVKNALAERFVFLEGLLITMEKQIIESSDMHDELVSRWIQAVNSLSGLAKALGVERKIKQVNLRAYMNGVAPATVPASTADGAGGVAEDK